MNDWTSGYVADVGYTYGYYNEMNPLRAELPFLYSGLSLPTFATACELGFGQGMSANIHAAASAIQWWGTDFNPSQVAFAQELAAAGTGAKLFDEAFQTFCARTDLPDFDYIGLHGIWSWVSDENRHVITDFLRRKLKVGGVAYVSYNSMPGWGAFLPLRELMSQYAETMGTRGQGIPGRIDGALDFIDRLMAVNPIYAKANPQVFDRIKRIKEQGRSYLAHEYFNRDWVPMSFERMHGWLSSAKLSFACSAHYVDLVDEVNLTSDQLALLKEIADPTMRQSVRDFCINQQFRRDYWVKGPRRLSGLEQGEALRARRFVLGRHSADVSLKVPGSLGEATMQEGVYKPILQVMSDMQPRSIGQIEAQLQGSGVNIGQLLQAVIVLVSQGAVHPVQDDAVVTKARRATEKLNAVLCSKARSNPDTHYLASPLTGGGVQVSRFQQIFLLAPPAVRKQPAELAKYAWSLVASQGQRLMKEGKALASEQENLAELTAQAEVFVQTQLPALKALQVA